jgi:DNA-binding response OmpR family regulator
LFQLARAGAATPPIRLSDGTSKTVCLPARDTPKTTNASFFLILCLSPITGLPRIFTKRWIFGAWEAITMDTVLIVEDSPPMQRTLHRLFEANSLQVQIAPDGPSGLECFLKQLPCAVVLDLKLPGMSGKELCREFKTLAASVPVVILSAISEVAHKVLLLELGADDYVTKPFSPKELLARVRRAMQRTGAQTPMVSVATKHINHEVLSFGDLRIDFTSMEAIRSGETVTLTTQEFKLLKYLVSSADRVVSREELLNEVWGYQNYPCTRTVDNYILRLRQKLEPDPAEPRFLLTKRGAGYKLGFEV